jgi:pyridoxal 5'-phosphate synthase pdxT subunit
MRIAVLALQGAFIEHRQMLSRLGVESVEIRQLKDWSQHKDGLIIPGGESTTQSKLLKDLGLLDVVKDDIEAGLPVFGTCAGLIMLAKQVEGQQPGVLSTMDISVCRNAYGRQLGSFFVESKVEGVGDNVPMTFIRAPYIKEVFGNAKVLAEVGGHIVAAKERNQLVTAFHPELNEDTCVHEYFLDMVRK